MRKFFQKENGEPKKVLLVGLGILGGGTSMAKFILDQGAILTITDLRKEEMLRKEMDIVINHQTKLNSKNKTQNIVNFVLEKHDEVLFNNADEVVFNPAVPYFSTWPTYCREKNIPIYNDFTLFQEYLNFKRNQNRQRNSYVVPKQVWVTGTRGKTTTTTFIHHLLGDKAVIGGNVLGQGLQKISDKKPDFFVLETSNYQLEYIIENKNIHEPAVAVITNIFVDHINRHKTVEEYRRVKKQIFKYNSNAALFLNKQEKSVQDIWKNQEHKNIYFANSKKEINILKAKYKNFSDNQLVSLGFAVLVAKYLGVSDKDVEKRIKSLPMPPMRQETVFENKKLKVINDSCATSPEALMAAMDYFKGAYFISGGTDAELDFTELVKKLRKDKWLLTGKLKLLKGTATDKLLSLSGVKEYSYVYDDLEKCLKEVLEEIKNSTKKGKSNKKQNTVILSPGAKSFGLFKNEYDRGEMFNKLVKKLLVK